MTAFETARETGGRGSARSALRGLRRDHPVEFDEAWLRARGELPIWLQYPTSEQDLVDLVVGWVQTADWTMSREYLDARPDELVSATAEAALEHLIDGNPSSAVLVEHLDLLRAARARGVHEAYKEHANRREIALASGILARWMGTPTWAMSRSFAEEHNEALLDDAVATVLDAVGTENLRDTSIRLHRGLLELCRSDGIDAAFWLCSDRRDREAAMDHADRAESADRLLMLARLDSGLEPGDPEAHFRLGIAALNSGLQAEAAAALADCGEHAAPYERHDFARRLDSLPVEWRVPLLVLTDLKSRLLADQPDLDA